MFLFVALEINDVIYLKVDCLVACGLVLPFKQEKTKMIETDSL